MSKSKSKIELTEEDIMKLIVINKRLMEENKRLKEINKELKDYLKSLTNFVFIDEDDC